MHRLIVTKTMIETLIFCSLPIVGILAFGIFVNYSINRLKKLNNGTK